MIKESKLEQDDSLTRDNSDSEISEDLSEKSNIKSELEELKNNIDEIKSKNIFYNFIFFLAFEENETIKSELNHEAIRREDI